MSLGFYSKVIYCLCTRIRANRVGFYMIPYIEHFLVQCQKARQKESYHVAPDARKNLYLVLDFLHTRLSLSNVRKHARKNLIVN
jgi:hypothetical protein